MPKNVVKVKPVNKDVFMYILRERHSSIRKLGNSSEIDCSERTLRRELKEKKGLREQYLDQIAKYLDVDSRFLSGELVPESFKTQDKNLEKLPRYLSDHIDRYPYFREEQSRLRREHIDETIRRILSLYEVSYKQFLKKNYEEKYNFQYDLFSAILPVMYKHFDQDGYGDTKREYFEYLLVQLEYSRDEYYETKWADTELRKEFLKKLPKGYTKNQIKKMSPSELIGLDMYLQEQKALHHEKFSK